MPDVTSIKNKPAEGNKNKNIFYNSIIKKAFKSLGVFLKDSVKSTKRMAISFAKEIADVFERDEVKIDTSSKMTYRKNGIDYSKDNELLKPNKGLFETLGLFLRSSLKSIKKFVASIVNEVADIFTKDDIKIDESYKVVHQKNATDNIKINELPIVNPPVSSPPSLKKDLFLDGIQFKFNGPLKDSEGLYDNTSATDHIYEEVIDLSKIVSMRYKQTEEKSHDESGHYDRLDHALSSAENQDKKITRLNGYARNEAKKCDGSGHFGYSFFRPSVDVPPPLPPKKFKFHT